MLYIEKIIEQSLIVIEDYKEQFIKIHRNRDFIVYFLRGKTVPKKFRNINNTISELKEWKIEFDQEYTKIKATKISDKKYEKWLISFEKYLNKVLEHISILENLQKIYSKSFFEKVKESQVIDDNLKRFDLIARECQKYADNYNKRVRSLKE